LRFVDQFVLHDALLDDCLVGLLVGGERDNCGGELHLVDFLDDGVVVEDAIFRGVEFDVDEGVRLYAILVFSYVEGYQLLRGVREGRRLGLLHLFN
jgi:hypothetical protein